MGVNPMALLEGNNEGAGMPSFLGYSDFDQVPNSLSLSVSLSLPPYNGLIDFFSPASLVTGCIFGQFFWVFVSFCFLGL